jgi:hypothetical protein
MARDRWRARLEDGLKLDLNKLIRDGLARPGSDCRSSIRWTRTRDGAEVASGRIAVNMLGEANGWFSLEVDGLRQEIALESRPRHFGGAQWYFVCPSRCRLCSVLWRPYGAKGFVSRQAWGRGVAYGSQFETPHDRALDRAQNLRRRLEGPKCKSQMGGILPTKPKGMHTRTYERKIEEIIQAEIVCDEYLAGFMARLMR